jgi:hypothetical protein
MRKALQFQDACHPLWDVRQPRRYSTDSGCFAKTPVRERFPR